MRDLVVCEVCHRHVKGGDAACPFCRKPLPGAKIALGVMTVGIALSVMACYGPPPREHDFAAPPPAAAEGGAPIDAADAGARR
jgi:hypothetical protein